MTVGEVAADHAVVERALAKVSDIATLPEVTVKIIQIVEDPKSTTRELHNVIKTDPALSAKVLKVVNSAFYGLPGQIASVDRAIILLGLSAVKNIAIAASINRLFKGASIGEGFTAKDLWKHSVAVGVAAKMIAKASGEPGGREEVFLAGLIHDLGILIERQVFPDLLSEVITKAKAGEASFIDLERRLMGADHQAFGDGLTTKWRFPRNLRAVVGYHHSPETLAPEMRKLGFIVHLADLIACEKNIGFYLTAAGQPITPHELENSGITADDFEQIRANLEAEVADAEATFG